MTFKKNLFGFGVFAIVLTLIPLIPSDHWWIRMFDFPHIQLTTLTFTAILTYLIKFNFTNKKDYLFITVLIICFAYQFTKIVPYTPFYDKEVLEATFTSEQSKVKLLTANVLQKNEQNDHLIDIIKELDADIMIFTEANKRWKEVIVESLSSAYKFQVEMPMDNTYGILMYSKLELINPEVKFMITDSIPSIHSKVKLRSGDIVQIYALHPTPPMPQENPLSTNRDAELMLTAQLARKSDLPVIVTGDFNDIPWSATSRLFQQSGELLDVRVGRGFYNTFNAKKYLLRWPLDHIYVSPEFRLSQLKNCAFIDSDHFPLYAELNFEPDGAESQMPDPVTDKQLERVQKQLDKLKSQKEN